MPRQWDPKKYFSPEHLAEHPELFESMVPVWGSAREAVADAYDGDYLGAVGNGVLAASDLIPLSLGGKMLYKSARYAGKVAKSTATDPTNWKNARRWMGEQGDLAPGQHGHHWLIPNGGIGKNVPGWIKNAPWNIKGMPVDDPLVHRRLHGRATIPGTKTRLPRYDVVEGYLHGTPTGAKVATAIGLGHLGAADKASLERRK